MTTTPHLPARHGAQALEYAVVAAAITALLLREPDLPQQLAGLTEAQKWTLLLVLIPLLVACKAIYHLIALLEPILGHITSAVRHRAAGALMSRALSASHDPIETTDHPTTEKGN